MRGRASTWAPHAGGLPSNAAGRRARAGDGILGLELHGKLNLIGLDTLAMIERAVASRASATTAW